MLRPASSACVGDAEPEVEGWAGSNVRSFLEDTGLAAINTHWTTGPTFFSGSSGYSSRVDHICLPAAAVSEGKVSSCWAMEEEGMQSQLIRSVFKTDHFPVAIKVSVGFSFQGSKTSNQFRLAVLDFFKLIVHCINER